MSVCVQHLAVNKNSTSSGNHLKSQTASFPPTPTLITLSGQQKVKTQREMSERKLLHLGLCPCLLATLEEMQLQTTEKGQLADRLAGCLPAMTPLQISNLKNLDAPTLSPSLPHMCSLNFPLQYLSTVLSCFVAN